MRRGRSLWQAVLVSCAASGLMSCHGSAQAASSARSSHAADLATMSLEELLNVEVTSVSRRPERLADAAASIFVISGEDIRRSGVTTLPEALRLAPNLHVAQAHASGYAINARGLNNSGANKLLVLIDGRSVYTPLFSGVFWDVQDVVLEDVERIEVISGPGGTLWGTNAVNGVINVITRSAKDTQGGLAAAGAGNREFGAARCATAARSAPTAAIACMASISTTTGQSTPSGAAKTDAWHKTQVGFRADWGGARDQFTVQGDAYRGSIGQPLPGTISITGTALALDTISVSGANLITRWGRTLAGGSRLTVQAYFDRTERTVPPTFGETLSTTDVQFQHSLRSDRRPHLHLGRGISLRQGQGNQQPIVAFLPARVNQTWLSLFAQDEIDLA